MKIRSVTLGIVPIFLAILIENGYIGVNENNIKEYINNNPNDISLFIENNFSKVVSKYNKSFDTKPWDASYIENKFEIIVNDAQETYTGVFLDFDKDNGYAVVGYDYSFLDFQTIGDSPFKNIKASEYYYYSTKGYFYNDESKIKSVNDQDNIKQESDYNFICGKHYDGQEENKTGCGKIKDTDLYIKSKYGDGWSLDKSKSLNMKGYEQDDLSCYRENRIENDSASGYSEANCWMVSAYTVLQYMQKFKWTTMPSDSKTVTYYPSISEKNVYSKYYDNNGNNKTKELTYNGGKSKVHQYELKSSSFTFSELYSEVRKHVSDKFSKVEGGTIWETSDIIEYIADKYGYKVNSNEHVVWALYMDAGTMKLDSGYPLLWSTSNDTYGSHTMAVCGYKYYSKTEGWWIFKNTQKKLFYELRDGHTTEARFYDMTDHVGFSAIISLEV